MTYDVFMKDTKIDKKYFIRRYSCPKCGEFEVIHSDKKKNKKCGWCGSNVKFIKTEVPV